MPERSSFKSQKVGEWNSGWCLSNTSPSSRKPTCGLADSKCVFVVHSTWMEKELRDPPQVTSSRKPSGMPLTSCAPCWHRAPAPEGAEPLGGISGILLVPWAGSSQAIQSSFPLTVRSWSWPLNFNVLASSNSFIYWKTYDFFLKYVLSSCYELNTYHVWR